jgi:dihydrofolate reductase
VIGGGAIFREALPLAERLYVTWVEAEVPGDTHFPNWRPEEWRLVSSEPHAADEKNDYDTTFCVYERT